jgi:4-hydroxybutyrate dehydrogenase
MKYFYIKPEIFKCNNFREFLKEFNVGRDDLILSNKIIHDSFIKNLKLSSLCINVDSYGEGEPCEEMVDAISREICGRKYKRVIAVGGGTVLDLGKVLALRISGSCSEILADKNPPVKDKELILIPTTCGSGSEMTFYSAIKPKEISNNQVFFSKSFFADYAVLIPELLSTLSYDQFIACSLEALAHAAEAFVSPRSNSYTDFFSHKAIEIILMGYLKLIESGKEQYINLLEDFLMASNYSGIAFGNTGLAAVQALSYPLTLKYNIPHGEANYLLFTEVFKKYNAINPTGKIRLLNNAFCEILQVQNDENIYAELQYMLDEFHPRENAREYGMLRDDIQAFSKLVVKEHRRLLINNYAHLTYGDFVDIYKTVY